MKKIVLQSIKTLYSLWICLSVICLSGYCYLNEFYFISALNMITFAVLLYNTLLDDISKLIDLISNKF